MPALMLVVSPLPGAALLQMPMEITLLVTTRTVELDVLLKSQLVKSGAEDDVTKCFNYLMFSMLINYECFKENYLNISNRN